jgi:hypothetical protein
MLVAASCVTPITVSRTSQIQSIKTNFRQLHDGNITASGTRQSSKLILDSCVMLISPRPGQGRFIIFRQLHEDNITASGTRQIHQSVVAASCVTPITVSRTSQIQSIKTNFRQLHDANITTSGTRQIYYF